MDASDFFSLKVGRAKEFGFPEPIFLNTEQLTKLTRILYIVEVQSMFIPDKKTHTTHHFSLKFSKFRKIKEEPFWEEVELTTQEGFTISDKPSIEKLAAYIKMNQELLGIDILSKEYTSVLFTNDQVASSVLDQVLSSEENKKVIFELLQDNYPELDKKILTYKLVKQRNSSLQEFSYALNDPAKKENNFWQPFLEKNRWMFGISFFVLLDESRIDLWDTADYLFESEDGFIDIVEIKHPHIDFWQKDSSGAYKEYRGNLQPSEELKGAMVQATNYIFQLEKKFSDPDWQRKNKCETPVKPTCTIILGRSNDWTIKEKTAFRLLNDSLHGINIITFDHLLNRAERLQKCLEDE